MLKRYTMLITARMTRVKKGARLRAERARAGVKRDAVVDGGIVVDAGECRRSIRDS